MSQTKDKSSAPRWWKPYWILLIIATIILGITMPFFTSIPFETSIMYMILTLGFLGLAYLGRVKQSLHLNRIMYILLGVFIGGVSWVVSLPFLNGLIVQGIDESTVTIVSLVVYFGILGPIIGDLIGRARNYKGPDQYQP